MVKALFIFLLSNLYIHANDDIGTLLENYEEKSALHNKTKVESAGNLIVFSREDLEKMQATSLLDLIKSVRSFTLEKDVMGNIKLQRAGAACASSSCIRLYVNDQEMSSASFGSALSIFGEYDLEHIDHVEVYLGGNAIAFGNEYGFMTIKMYTKEPSREKGSLVGLSYGTQDSYTAKVLTTGSMNDLDYLVYANKTEENAKSIHNKGVEIQRESQNLNIYGMLKKENDFTLELSHYEHNHDALGGLGIQKTPQEQKMNGLYQYAAFTKYINSAKLQVSYAQEEIGPRNTDSNGIRLYDGATVNSLDNQFSNKIFKVNLQNKTELGKHNFVYGLEYQRKDLSFNSTIDGVDRSSEYQGTEILNMYALFGEYGYQYNENLLFITTLKYELYDNDYNNRTDDQFQFRTGVIGVINDNFTLKVFYANNHIYPGIAELATYPYPKTGNANLQPIDVENYSTELIYTNGRHNASAGYTNMAISNPILLTSTQAYFNKDITVTFHDYFANYTFKANSDHKFMFEYFISTRDIGTAKTPLEGGYIKLFDTFGAFDFYNELIYREGYYNDRIRENLASGYDFTSVITYHQNNALTLSLRGENLFDKSLKSPIPNVGAVSIMDRRVMLNMELFF